jgi:hypothetical protein
MTVQGWKLLLASALPVSGLIAMHGALTFDPRRSDTPLHVMDPPEPATRSDAVSPGPAPVDTIIQRNIFRDDRSADPATEDGEAEGVTADRSRVRLLGVILGRHPAALFGQVPGQTSPRLIEPGDTLGGFRLISVTDSTALITFGADSVLLVLGGSTR